MSLREKALRAEVASLKEQLRLADAVGEAAGHALCGHVARAARLRKAYALWLAAHRKSAPGKP